MPDKLKCYDMRKINPSLSSDEQWNMAFLREIEGTYYPFFMSSSVRNIPDNQIALEKASERGVLFAYADVSLLNPLGPIADELNKNPNADLTTLIDKYLKPNEPS